MFNHQALGPLVIFDRVECFEDLGAVEVLSNSVTYCGEILAVQNKNREGFHMGNLLH